MAQKRMIDKKISISEQVANLPIEAQLLFTWMIPHADDLGLLPSSSRTIKAMVVPMLDITVAKIDEYLTAISKQGLITAFEHRNEGFWRLVKFRSNQTLKRDRQPQTLLNIEFNEDPKKTWKALETLGFHLEAEDFQMDTEVKGSEVKIIEVNRIEERAKALTPSEEAKEFFNNPDKQQEVITSLVAKGFNESWVKQEIKKFTNHWTERTKSGKQENWETKKTFEVGRRLVTWFNNAAKWNKDQSFKQTERIAKI